MLLRVAELHIASNFLFISGAGKKNAAKITGPHSMRGTKIGQSQDFSSCTNPNLACIAAASIMARTELSEWEAVDLAIC